MSGRNRETIPESQAFPQSTSVYGGLTIRQYYAGKALQGLLADSESRPEQRKDGETCCDATARLAVEHADCLIRALNR